MRRCTCNGDPQCMPCIWCQQRIDEAESACTSTSEARGDHAMKPSAKRVLQALTAAGGRGATTHELCQPDVGGIRFGGRIHELRALGYAITAQRERAGSTRYTLRNAGAERRAA